MLFAAFSTFEKHMSQPGSKKSDSFFREKKKVHDMSFKELSLGDRNHGDVLNMVNIVNTQGWRFHTVHYRTFFMSSASYCNLNLVRRDGDLPKRSPST